jgi:hypothetical protein
MGVLQNENEHFLYINELITRLSASAKSCSHSNIQAGCPAQTDYITLSPNQQ